MNLKNKSTPRHNITNLSEVKDRDNFESCKRKTALYVYKGSFVRLLDGFSTETTQARRDRDDT